MSITITAVSRAPAPKRKRPKRPIEAERRTVPIASCVLDDLKDEAEARGVSVPELVRRLVGTIAEDGLVTAVLDDAGGVQ